MLDRISPILLFWIIVAMSFIDFGLTCIVLDNGGIEANPYVNLYIEALGKGGILVAKAPGLITLGVIVLGMWSRLSPVARQWTKRALVALIGGFVVLNSYSSYLILSN